MRDRARDLVKRVFPRSHLCRAGVDERIKLWDRLGYALIRGLSQKLAIVSRHLLHRAYRRQGTMRPLARQVLFLDNNCEEETSRLLNLCLEDV